MFCFLITFLQYIENHFPHALGRILLIWRLTEVLISDPIFTQAFIWNSGSIYFTMEVNLFCSWAQPSISILGLFVVEVWKYIQYRREGSVFYGSACDFNIPMNITIGIRSKIDPSGLQQKCISGDFP